MTDDQSHGGGLNVPLVLHRITELEEWRREMSAATKQLASNQESLRLLLAESAADRRSLHEVLDHSTRTLATVDGRVRTVEDSLPILKETSRWVMVGVIGVAGLVGIAVFNNLAFK